MRSRSCLACVVLVAALVVTAGCGTTVSGRQAAGPAAGSDGLQAGGSGGPAVGPVTGTAGTAGTAGTGGVSGASSGSGSARSTATSGTSPTTGDATGTTGRVVGATTPVEVGFFISEGLGVAAAAVGFTTPNAPDPEKAWQALVNQQNARGGLLGHKITPVYYTIDGTRNQAAEEQAACATLTQDHHVLAAFVGELHSVVLLDCLERAGVAALIMTGTSLDDAVVFRQHPHARSVGTLNLTRLARVYVDGLVAQGFFTRGAKIGLVVWDDPVYARVVDRVLKPALARHGLRLSDEARVSPTRDLPAAGPSGSQNGAAVLQFQTSGITHVLFLGISGSPGFFFIKAAEGQNYYPQYGLSSNDKPVDLMTNVSEQSAKNFWGVGWIPSLDTSGTPTGPQATACKTLMAKAGQPPAYKFCDSMAVMVAGGRSADAPLTADRLLAGLDTSGPLNLSEFTLDYGSNRRDGVIRARSLRHLTSCSCLRYTSGPYAVPN